MAHTTALLSTNWYRIEQLRPRLRGHVRIHRHAYRGEVWYVMRASASRSGATLRGSDGPRSPPHPVGQTGCNRPHQGSLARIAVAAAAKHAPQATLHMLPQGLQYFFQRIRRVGIVHHRRHVSMSNSENSI